MNHKIPYNFRTIFGHILTPDNFWTKICLASWTSDGLGQRFLLKLAPLPSMLGTGYQNVALHQLVGGLAADSLGW